MACRAAMYCFLAFAAMAAVSSAWIDISGDAGIHSPAPPPPLASTQDTDMTRQTFNTAALRKHAALFTLAAGVTAGGIAGIGALYQGNSTDASAVTASDAVQPASSAPALRPRQDVVAGPVAAKVLKTGDGDTVQTEAEIWPGLRVLIDIRIGGIDTPEKKGRAKCPEEAARAEDATAEMRRLLEGKAVTLHNIKYEKYGGRLLADIVTPEGVDARAHMIAQRLAVPYGGGTKSSWCALAQGL
jgi:micrococcal nuclease